jgi:hypothetical protein
MAVGVILVIGVAPNRDARKCQKIPEKRETSQVGVLEETVTAAIFHNR